MWTFSRPYSLRAKLSKNKCKKTQNATAPRTGAYWSAAGAGAAAAVRRAAEGWDCAYAAGQQSHQPGLVCLAVVELPAATGLREDAERHRRRRGSICGCADTHCTRAAPEKAVSSSALILVNETSSPSLQVFPQFK